MLIALLRLELDQNLLALGPPSGVQLVDLQKNLGGHREQNDHLGIFCPESGRQDLPRSRKDSIHLKILSSNVLQEKTLQG